MQHRARRHTGSPVWQCLAPNRGMQVGWGGPRAAAARGVVHAASGSGRAPAHFRNPPSQSSLCDEHLPDVSMQGRHRGDHGGGGPGAAGGHRGRRAGAPRRVQAGGQSAAHLRVHGGRGRAAAFESCRPAGSPPQTLLQHAAGDATAAWGSLPALLEQRKRAHCASCGDGCAAQADAPPHRQRASPWPRKARPRGSTAPPPAKPSPPSRSSPTTTAASSTGAGRGTCM